MITPKNILLIVAMHDEATPIIDKLKLKNKGKVHHRLPMVLFSATYKKSTINLILNGKSNKHFVDHIGSQAATLSTQIGIDELSPDLIINIGTAGGFNSDSAKIGDVYLSYPCVCFHDRRINLPGFYEYGIGYYPCIPCGDIAKTLGLKTGIITTGNSLDYTQEDLEMMRKYNGVVKDMEAAAVAWVAYENNVPFLAIKAITDMVDGDKPTEEEFVKNLGLASKNLADQTLKVLNLLLKH